MGEPTGIGSILARLSAGWGIEDPLASAKLFHTWEAIVGPEIAAQCRPSSFKGGVLKVRASSQGWASQLKYLAPKMIERINQELGTDLVKEVKAWVDIKGPGESPSKAPSRSSPTGPSQARATQSKAGFPQDYPQAEKDRETVDRLVAEISDEKLAEAAKRALLAGKMRQRTGPSDGIL